MFGSGDLRFLFTSSRPEVEDATRSSTFEAENGRGFLLNFAPEN